MPAHVLARKGRPLNRITVRCFGTPLTWLWNILSFMNNVEVVEVMDRGAWVDLECVQEGKEDECEARICAVHRMASPGEVPFLVWARYACDCIVVDRTGRVWELVEFRIGNMLIMPYINGFKDLGAFKQVSCLLRRS